MKKHAKARCTISRTQQRKVQLRFRFIPDTSEMRNERIQFDSALRPQSYSLFNPFSLMPTTLLLPPLTSAMCLGLDDLTDAPWAHAVLGGQLDLVPGSTAQVVQPEGAFAGADEYIPPFLCVVHRILQHKSCRVTQHNFMSNTSNVEQQL